MSGGVWDGFPDNCCSPPSPPLRAKLCNRLWLTAVKALRILYPETDSSKSASTAWKPESSPRGPWAQYLESRPGPGPGPAPSTQLRTRLTNTSTSWALFSSPAAGSRAECKPYPHRSDWPGLFTAAQELELMVFDWSMVVHTHGTAPPPALGAGAGSGTLRHRAGRGLAPSLPVRSQPRFLGHLLTVPSEVLSSRLELRGAGRKAVRPRPSTGTALSVRRAR